MDLSRRDQQLKQVGSTQWHQRPVFERSHSLIAMLLFSSKSSKLASNRNTSLHIKDRRICGSDLQHSTYAVTRGAVLVNGMGVPRLYRSVGLIRKKYCQELAFAGFFAASKKSFSGGSGEPATKRAWENELMFLRSCAGPGSSACDVSFRMFESTPSSTGAVILVGFVGFESDVNFIAADFSNAESLLRLYCCIPQFDYWKAHLETRGISLSIATSQSCHYNSRNSTSSTFAYSTRFTLLPARLGLPFAGKGVSLA
jgi:hypothetical protein